MKLFVMNMRKSIREQYLKLLDREPTLDDLDFYADEIQKNKINLEQLSILLKNSNEYAELQKKEIPQNKSIKIDTYNDVRICLLYTSPSPRDGLLSRMPSSA